MESIARGMRRLQADAAFFARATELRLLHVTATAETGGGALKLCAAQEFHADNKSLYFSFEEPFLVDNDGWYSRGQTLRKQYAEKQKGLAKEGILLPALSAPEKRSPPVAEFTAIVQEVLRGLVSPLAGLVLVLAPKRSDQTSPFPAELRQLINSPALAAVRWIVIERDLIVARPLADELGKRALTSEWISDEGEKNKDMKAMIGPFDPSLPFTPKMPKWQPPGAGPDVEAPPRKDDPAPPNDEQLAAEGISPDFVKGGAQLLQKLLLGGALALKEGRPADAIRMQGLAADLCGRLGMVKAQILNTLILGSYFMTAQLRPQARKTYEQAKTQAGESQMKDEEAQANLSLGMLDQLEGQHQHSMGRYSAAGEIAEASGNHVLAIECWRTAGQLAFNLKAYDAALEPWLRATKIASGMEPKQVKTTSAAECARGVATILRSRGQNTEARTFEETSFRYEHGLEPNAPVPPA